MVDGIPLNAGSGFRTVETTGLLNGNQLESVRMGFIDAGVFVPWSPSDPFPITFPGSIAVTGPLTNAELRASPIDVAVTGAVVIGGIVAVNNFPASQAVTGTFFQATQPVSGPLTDIQLRATPVPISGTIAISGTVPVSGGLTDTQLRATPIPVSGTFFQATQPVSGAFFQATQPVSGPLTDVQLRAVAVPVSGPLTDTQLRAAVVPVVAKCSTGTNTSVVANIASTLLLASNANRRGASFMLDTGASALYLLLGATVASLTNYSLLIAAGGYYEVPFGYTGEIRGIFAGATGSVRVTELT